MTENEKPIKMICPKCNYWTWARQGDVCPRCKTKFIPYQKNKKPLIDFLNKIARNELEASK